MSEEPESKEVEESVVDSGAAVVAVVDSSVGKVGGTQVDSQLRESVSFRAQTFLYP